MQAAEKEQAEAALQEQQRHASQLSQQLAELQQSSHQQQAALQERLNAAEVCCAPCCEAMPVLGSHVDHEYSRTLR